MILVMANVAAQQPFITKWEVTSQDLSITIPTIGSGYNYSVNFGDGTILNNVNGDATHSYNYPGIYTVSISGDFPRIHFEGSASLYKIIGIEQWGDIQWQSMEEAFSGCSNLLIEAVDAPDLSQVTSLRRMLERTMIYTNLNSWDVSNITDMSSMFKRASFNLPLDSWNVSNVTNMNSMFYKTDFNYPINNWDVSNVTDMGYMFYQARWFNQTVENWDVSNVTDMSYMFGNPENYNYFDQPLNGWNVSSVTNMAGMFMNTFFHQPLDNWNVSNVINMQNMFGGGLLNPYNQPVGNWNVSSVTNMASMFAFSAYNQPLNDWDVSNVTDMSRMFAYAREYNQPLNSWDVSNVTTMNEMFRTARDFNQPLNDWDVSSVIDMKDMFNNSSVFNHPLNNWNISNAIDLSGMFKSASSFNQPLNNWNVSNVTNVKNMFYKATTFNQDFRGWNFNGFSLVGFVSFSGLDIHNYDLLLAQLASSNIYSRTLGADGLEYCNHTARDYMRNTLGWFINGDVQSENCNSITGMVIYDEDNSGCDSNDIGISGFMINATNDDYSISTFSRNGLYELGTIGTSFTISLVNIPEYFTADPVSAEINFTNSNIEQVDFCVTATQTIADLSITILPITSARPGFEAEYQLIIENRGTETVPNFFASLVFDDTAQTFLHSSPTPVSNTSNELLFEFQNLAPFNQQIVDLTMETFAPPLVNGGDILTFTANVTPNENDYTPEDNTFVYDQIVVNSFDPNDKQVLQGEEIYLDETDKYLEYLIRFQNTGTASAVNVRILDSLHPKLDWTTLQPVNASHDYHIEITDGNQVEFVFDNINLPHEGANEEESQGFVAYKIKPKNNVQVGNVISGNARIYFDFNAPIITNTVFTEIVDRVVSTEDNNAILNRLFLYPNPSYNNLNLRTTTDGIKIIKTTIYSLQGQKMGGFQLIDNSINIENLASGMYLLKIETNLGIVNRNFIRK